MRSCESWSMRRGGQRVRTHSRNVTCSTVLRLCEVTCSCESNVLFLWHVLNVKLWLVLEQSQSSCQSIVQFYFKNERFWMRTLHFQQIYSICLGSAVPVGHCPVLFDSFLTQRLISSLSMSRETCIASEAVQHGGTCLRHTLLLPCASPDMALLGMTQWCIPKTEGFWCGWFFWSKLKFMLFR